MRLGKLILISSLLIVSTTAFTQNSAPAAQSPQTPAPTIHVYSRETVIDVLVTDDKGQPITGLTKSDFTVEEDDKPQPIRSFAEYDKTTPPPPAPALPPDTYTNSRTLPANGPVQIFIFDLLGTAPDVMERAKKYVAEYFRTMPAGTQVALFEFSPSKDLVLLHDFTTDGAAAADAVDKLDVEWNRNPVIATRIAIAGMNRIADYVAGIHGRKNLIWLVPGMPLMINRDGGYSAAPHAPDMTIVHRLMDLYDRFTQEEIAIYPRDPRGVHGLGITALDAIDVAGATGGTTANSNDYKTEIATIVDGTSHFYTLSYVPTRPDEDGHFHPIRITVNRPGAHLSYRTGYNDEQPHAPEAMLIHDMVQGPMRLGAIPSTQLLFDLHVQPNPAAPQAKTAAYNALFTFSPTQIGLTEAPDGTRSASVEIDLGAYDFYGKLVAVRSQTFKMTITSAQYASFIHAPLKFPLSIDLPRGQLTLRAGLFDTLANKAGTLETPLTVPKK